MRKKRQAVREGGGGINWILTGKALYINKEKALSFLSHQSAPIAATAANEELSTATKIVEEFENPTLPEKINISLDDHIKEIVTEQAASLGEAVEFVTAEQMKSFLTLPRLKSCPYSPG